MSDRIPEIMGDMWFERPDGTRVPFFVARAGYFERVQRLVEAARAAVKDHDWSAGDMLKLQDALREWEE